MLPEPTATLSWSSVPTSVSNTDMRMTRSSIGARQATMPTSGRDIASDTRGP